MTEKLKLRITGMDCADCALKLEKGVANLAGVEACQVNFTTAKMEVITRGADEAQIVKRIQSLGYNIASPDEVYQPRTRRQQLADLLRQPRNTFTLIGAAFIAAAFILEGLLPAGENFLFNSPAPLLSLPHRRTFRPLLSGQGRLGGDSQWAGLGYECFDVPGGCWRFCHRRVRRSSHGDCALQPG
jgi:cation transport ATPase